MKIRPFQPGEELALLEVFYSAIHLIARNDASEEQLNGWAALDIDRALWADRINGINPFVAEIDGKPVGYANVQQHRQGVGKALMQVIHREAKRSNITELTANVSQTAQPTGAFEVADDLRSLTI